MNDATDDTLNFSVLNNASIINTQDSSQCLLDFCRARGLKHLFVVTDQGLFDCGLIQPLIATLNQQGIQVSVFSQVVADPPQAVVEQAIAQARQLSVDAVIGFGGGSSLDTAKLVALLAHSKQTLNAVIGVDLARGHRLPLVQIPTTAGTGSEVTPIAIITTPKDEKKGIVSPLLLADLAVLNAEYTLSLNPALSAMTGIDAMVHAIEAYTSKLKKNPISDALAIGALKLMLANLDTAVDDGQNIAARNAMLVGSNMAGLAFANAPVGAVHALAYPLGSVFHIAHGHSNALVLIEVLKFNAQDHRAKQCYARLARALLPETLNQDDAQACAHFIATLQALLERMPITLKLSELGIERTELEPLAAGAMQVQRLLVNNPRAMNQAQALAIYQNTY